MLMFIPFHINFGFRWKFSFKNSIHKPLMCLRTHQFISIIITIKCLYLLGDIAHQMQHIDFVENPSTSTLVNLTTHLYLILDEPTSHFGSTQGSLIAPPHLHQNDKF
jgi:uncharacterized membrane protein